MAKTVEKESIRRDRQLVHFSVRTHVRVANNINGQLHKLNEAILQSTVLIFFLRFASAYSMIERSFFWPLSAVHRNSPTHNNLL